MTFFDYSHLTLAVIGADNRTLQKFGDISLLRSLTNPSALFLNAPEVYVFVRQKGVRQITLWREGFPTVSLGVADGADVDPQAVLRLLRSASHVCASPQQLFADAGLRRDVPCLPMEETAAVNSAEVIPRGKVPYLSTNDIVNLIDTNLRSPEARCSELLAVQATAVAVGEATLIPRVTVTNVGLYDFEVTPAEEKEVVPKKKVQTLQEIEDEIEAESETAAHRPRSRRLRGVWVFVVLALLALCAGWAAVRYIPSLIPDSTPYDGMENSIVSSPADDYEIATPEIIADTLAPVGAADSAAIVSDTILRNDTLHVDDNAPVTPVAESAVAPEEKTAVADAAAEKADIAYLNANTVWRRADLKSDKYRQMFDLISSGNIKAIAESDYFAVTGVATNRTATKMMDMLWQAYRSPTQRSNELQLKKLKGKGEIDIAALYITLSRYRDANPNKTPRPKR